MLDTAYVYVPHHGSVSISEIEFALNCLEVNKKIIGAKQQEIGELYLQIGHLKDYVGNLEKQIQYLTDELAVQM